MMIPACSSRLDNASSTQSWPSPSTGTNSTLCRAFLHLSNRLYPADIPSELRRVPSANPSDLFRNIQDKDKRDPLVYFDTQVCYGNIEF